VSFHFHLFHSSFTPPSHPCWSWLDSMFHACPRPDCASWATAATRRRRDQYYYNPRDAPESKHSSNRILPNISRPLLHCPSSQGSDLRTTSDPIATQSHLYPYFSPVRRTLTHYLFIYILRAVPVDNRCLLSHIISDQQSSLHSSPNTCRLGDRRDEAIISDIAPNSSGTFKSTGLPTSTRAYTTDFGVPSHLEV
jgi:hypothetical protein